MSAEAAARFKTRANDLLVQLKFQNESSLNRVDDQGIRETTRRAKIIRRALIVYRGSLDVLHLSETGDTAQSRVYLQQMLPLIFNALNEERYNDLSQLSQSVQIVLDGMLANESDLFATVPDIAVERDVKREYEQNGKSLDDVPISADELPFQSDANIDDDGVQIGRKNQNAKKRTGKRNHLKTKYSPEKSSLQKRQKIILALYILMVIAATTAVVFVTINFINETKDPGGLIDSVQNDTLLAPVVTVCLSQPGIPFSRLQLFNFTDAEGVTFVGADPRGTYETRVSPEFEEVVERFWHNPNNESCNTKVGDYFPFPIESLNSLTNGTTSTLCRPCYRVGRKRKAYASSTAFQRSSILNFYTDTYFLQCTKSEGGLSTDGLAFLHNQLLSQQDAMFSTGVLSIESGVSVNETTIGLEEFQKVTSQQACNIFYFAFFPIRLELADENVDIRYIYNGTGWNRHPNATGPWFEVKKTSEFLPTESLQLTVEGHNSVKNDSLNPESDLMLLGPNTQTFATFRPLVVFGSERYDISSSTSNLFQSDITPIFGYWLVYRVYYNYNRFVVDRWYSQSTYPVFQWLADVLGYLGLFTGVSVFSLILLPVLRALQRRDRVKLQQQSPEGYVWSKHKKLLHSETDGAKSSESVDQSIALPGYNV